MHKDNTNYAALEIHPHGKIIYNDWVYDHDKGEGEYIERDVSMFMDWMHKRDKTVWIHPDVILNDIFIIASGQPELCDIAFPNCFIAEYIKSWEKLSGIDFSKKQYDPKELEYIELYWAPEVFEGEINGVDLLYCHGRGFELREDYDDGHGCRYEKGSRISWGIDFCELKELLPLPIKVNTEFQVYDNWEKYKDKISEGMKWKDIPKLLDVKRFVSLGQVIEGIFWELSFYGSEEEKLENKDIVTSRADEIDELLENNTVDELVKKGKLVNMSEHLNDGYINDGWVGDKN